MSRKSVSVLQTNPGYSVMIYARVNPAAEEHSLEQQIVAVTQAALEEGMHVLGTFSDTASGLTGLDQREGGAALLAALETSGADAVYCRDIFRISRDPVSVCGSLTTLSDRGVALHIVGLADPIGPTRVLIWAAIHQYERDQFVHRMRVGRERKKSQEAASKGSDGK